jgi:hypothetical protein
MPRPLRGREIPVAMPKILRELALKIVLAVVGLLFIALGYPMVVFSPQDPALSVRQYLDSSGYVERLAGTATRWLRLLIARPREATHDADRC